MRDDQEIAECLSPSAAQEAGLDPMEAAIDLSESEHSDQGVSLAACLCTVALPLAFAPLLPILHRPILRAASPLPANLIVSRSIKTVPLPHAFMAVFSHAVLP